MKEIGGYFGLELPKAQADFIHSGCAKVNSGRHALEYILRALGNKVKKVWLPYYTCEVVLQPMSRLNIDYDFYHINSCLELEDEIALKDGEYIIVNNYFGIKDAYIQKMANLYGSRLIVDNAQAWYAKEMPGIFALYSPRKFFGMPDGGLAYCSIQLNQELERNPSYGRCSHLLKRIDIDAGCGYSDFRNNSKELGNEALKRMSKLSERILSSINFEQAKDIRRSNFQYLHNQLKSSNLLTLSATESFECPMVYPYMTDDPTLRQRLIDNKIFVATYWPNVLDWCGKDTTEHNLTQKLIPLPIDQRYGKEEMNRIIGIIQQRF